MGVATTAAARCYTAPPEAVKLYQSTFTAGPFPVDFVSSDTVVYAQFLYKLAEPSKSFDTYLKDFDTLKGELETGDVSIEAQRLIDSIDAHLDATTANLTSADAVNPDATPPAP